MRLVVRRYCTRWAIATAVLMAAAIGLYLAGINVGGWASIGIAVGVAISRAARKRAPDV